MIFTYKKWDKFCYHLSQQGIYSLPACLITPQSDKFLVLKHDVETNVNHAYKMAVIEKKNGHKGSYYVQAYLLKDSNNIALLKKMQEMGHEISYHYDVLDSCKGNLNQAIEEFEFNRSMFEKNGFPVVTVCQHGNPVVERIGYTSNRDFFRSQLVQSLFPGISDIMVNYKEVMHVDYLYFSDAGRRFQLIFDPINNDRINSDHKNIVFDDLSVIYEYICQTSSIVSVHPHRWTALAIQYQARTFVFKGIKRLAKLLLKIPFLRKIMGRYYYLAKKI